MYIAGTVVQTERHNETRFEMERVYLGLSHYGNVSVYICIAILSFLVARISPASGKR